jgi:two-component system NtrC family sensor kinase
LEKSQTKLIQAEKMASQSALIVNVSQAFQNPVNLISNGIEILKLTWQDIQDDCPIEHTENFEELKEDFESTLSDMKASVDEMHKTTLGLQNFSQLSDDTFRLFDLHSGIDAILLILKERWRNSVKVVGEYDENLSEVYCMPNQMNQVFMSLIENALEAIEKKGIITIRTKKQDGLAIFEFQNDGSKIAKYLVDSIFLPFVTIKPNEFHSGMGLAIARDIIEKHKGTIRLKDLENSDTCFVVSIPRAEKID